jgi:hypothetical protein
MLPSSHLPLALALQLMVTKLLIANIMLSTDIVCAQDFTCDAIADSTGPCQHKGDGICDSNLGDNPIAGCENGDCMDCNIYCT